MRRFLLGAVVTTASMALLVRVIDWETTLAVLARADPTFIALAVACLVLSLGAKTARWRLLLPSDAPLTTTRLYRILHISFFLNNVFPARLGDVARVAMTSNQPGVRFGHVLSSLLTERVTDAVTLLACFVAVSPFLPVAREYVSWLHIAWAVLGSLIGLCVAGVLLRRPIARAAGSLRLGSLPGGRVVRAEAASFRDGWGQLFSRRRLLRIWGLSGAAWIAAFAINYLLMRALGIHTPIAVAVLLTCTTNLAMLLPSSPGYIGVFHVAATLSLLPFNVAESTAFSFAILAHIVNVLPVSIIGGAFLLAGRDGVPFRRRAVDAAAPTLPH